MQRFIKMSPEEREKYPTRMGQAWKDDETLELLKAIRRSETHEQIAKKHERTVGGIVCKLRSLAADYYFYENRPIEQIIKITGLSNEEIQIAIKKRAIQKGIKERKEINDKIQAQNTKPIPTETVISVLKDIRDLMREYIELQKTQIKI